MKIFAITLLMLAGFFGANDAAQAQQSSCKVCSDQQRACMKNYADLRASLNIKCA